MMKEQIIKLIIAVFLFFGLQVFAQNVSDRGGYRAQVFSLEATIYSKPDFDSPTIATVQGGKIFLVSSRLFNGAFYKIQVKPGLIGYIADSDVKPLWKKTENQINKSKNSEAEGKKKNAIRSAQKKTRRRPFPATQYVGLSLASIEHKENTMGDHRRDQLMFYGVKLSGPNLVVDGDFPTEINFLFHNGAPKYYEEITGRPADGWIIIMNFLWQNYFPQTKDSFLFFGFGPNFKYSKYSLSLTETSSGKNLNYSAEDMLLGAVFNFGISGRIGPAAIRAEYVYYWEKEMYGSFGLSLQKEF